MTADVTALEAPHRECACERCQRACQSRPGWFLPGEPEKAAALLGMPLPEFFKTYLAVDWLEDQGEEDIFVLAPALKSSEPGEMYPAEPIGECAFYQDGGCAIHAAKPKECAIAHHDREEDASIRLHIACGSAWDKEEHQTQVRELLGRQPEAEHGYSPFAAIPFMLGFHL